MNLDKGLILPLLIQIFVSMANKILLHGLGKGSNYVSSPFSLHIMLSLIAAGAKGSALKQLLSCLGSESIGCLNDSLSRAVTLIEHQQQDEEVHPSRELPILLLANGIWVDQTFGFNPSFEGIARIVYKVETKEVDFGNKADQVRQEVNSWAETTTRGLIKEVLPPRSIDSTTALILVNALYFKGAWNQRFDPSNTEHKDFYLLNGKTVQVPFMTGARNDQCYNYRTFDGYKVLQLPYQRGSDSETRQFSMYFFLPDKRDGLPNLIQELSSQSGFFNQRFELWNEEVPVLWIPRCKLSFEFEASKAIKEMGLDIIFEPGQLTEMVSSDLRDGNRQFYLSKIFHKAYIEINEKGTEAAACTAAQMRWRRCVYPAPSFVADHPFMFILREETCRAVLFIGAVLNPLDLS